MSVILETSKGDIIIDLYTDDCPKACENFIKLCKLKYYNNVIFYNVQRNFLLQTGDPTNTGKGGDSLWGVLYGEQARFFEDEIRPQLKHKRRGMVGMASAGENLNASQFYITTGENLDSLDEKHTLFGEVAEGLDVIEAINDAPVDDNGRPLQNIRIRHSIILDDPFPDPPTLESHIPEASPSPQFANDGRLEDDWIPEDETRAAEEIEASNREKEAKSRAVVLEMIGDLPEAEAAPPENMLFICKLNAVTTEEDLEIIFSRFGTLTSCDIIRDWKTGDSLNYGFIGFDTKEASEEAYFKMNNVLIDDRRIKVDFSQSVSHLWKQFSKFGRKGDAGLMKEAEGHERGGREQLQLKDQFRRGGGGRDGGKYDLVLEDDDIVGRNQGMKPPRQYNNHRNGGDGVERRRNRSRDREHKDSRRERSRDRYKDNRRRKERRRTRSRSRSRDRHERRHRSRSRSREMERSRGKDRRGRRDSRDEDGYHRR